MDEGHVLSTRDIEALRMYANGDSTVDIAVRMNVKFDIAREHLNHVREYFASKGLDVQSKRDLVRCATEDGLLNTGTLSLPDMRSV